MAATILRRRDQKQRAAERAEAEERRRNEEERARLGPLVEHLKRIEPHLRHVRSELTHGEEDGVPGGELLPSGRSDRAPNSRHEPIRRGVFALASWLDENHVLLGDSALSPSLHRDLLALQERLDSALSSWRVEDYVAAFNELEGIVLTHLRSMRHLIG